MSLDFQRKNPIKQAEENLKERYKQHQLLAPARVQDHYNKENLEIQHQHDLEIFKKQKRLTIGIAIFTVLCSFMGILLGILMERLWLSKTPVSQLQKYQDKTSIKAAPVNQTIDTKPSASGVSSSKNVSSKPPP
jgi:hypothetical protein